MSETVRTSTRPDGLLYNKPEIKLMSYLAGNERIAKNAYDLINQNVTNHLNGILFYINSFVQDRAPKNITVTEEDVTHAIKLYARKDFIFGNCQGIKRRNLNTKTATVKL